MALPWDICTTQEASTIQSIEVYHTHPSLDFLVASFYVSRSSESHRNCITIFNHNFPQARRLGCRAADEANISVRIDYCRITIPAISNSLSQ